MPQPDHAERAVRSALLIRDRMREIGGEPSLRLRLGLHTGTALVGNIGARERLNYTLVGDTVNVTQRLEQLGKEIAPTEPIVILASASTATHARGLCTVEPLGAAPAARQRRDGRGVPPALVATVLNFLALYWLPLGEVAAITFTSPIIVAALAVPLLGEHIGRARWFATPAASAATPGHLVGAEHEREVLLAFGLRLRLRALRDQQNTGIGARGGADGRLLDGGLGRHGRAVVLVLFGWSMPNAMERASSPGSARIGAIGHSAADHGAAPGVGVSRAVPPSTW